MSSILTTQAFYALTLINSSATTAAVTCHLVPRLPKLTSQILEARGSRLYLYYVKAQAAKTDAETATVSIVTVFEQDVFSIVRGLTCFRIPGAKTDCIVIASDSGRLGMYSYDPAHNRLKEMHLETFGKSGIRRTIPGQYLVSDPQGRCQMLASTEKDKIVYIHLRKPEGGVVISSPHEAKSPNTLTFDVCALDTDWESPCFVALETDYTQAQLSEDVQPSKVIAYYTVVLGVNNVFKTRTTKVDYTANKVVGVPSGDFGPGGVLVCAKGRIYWMRDELESMSIQIPRREGPLEDLDRDRIIVCATVHVSKNERSWFALLQTDDGDVFRFGIDLEDTNQKSPHRIVLKYFETFPVASKILVLVAGYLYVAAEHGPAHVYHVNSLAEDLEYEPENNFFSTGCSDDPRDTLAPVYFSPRGARYVWDMLTVPALHPLMKARVENIAGDDAPQIVELSGTGKTSALRIIRHCMPAVQRLSIELAKVHYDNAWSLKLHAEDEQHGYLALSSSSSNRSVILKVEGEKMNTAHDTGFVTTRSSILFALMGDSTHVQVHTRAAHFVRRSGSSFDWDAPENSSIVQAAANNYQLVCGLSTGDVALILMRPGADLSVADGILELESKITAIGVAETSVGELQAKWAVIGCEDQLVRVVSILQDSPLELASMAGLTDVPVSIVVVNMLDPDSGTTATYAHIGLQNGIHIRALIDEVNGTLENVRRKFLGAHPVRISPIELYGQKCIIACCTKPWLGYHHPVTGQYTMVPLDMDWCEFVAPINTSSLDASVIAVAGNKIRFMSPTALGQRFVTQEVPLRYTPRAMTRHPEHNYFYVVQSDGNTMSQASSDAYLQHNKDRTPYAEDAVLGNPHAPGHWASCVQVIDPTDMKTVIETIHLDNNEAALCCDVVKFDSKDPDYHLVVGTGRDMNGAGANRGGGCLRAYLISEDGKSLQLVYTTTFDHPIYSLIAFKGRLAVGIGNELFIYDMGEHQFLRKTRGMFVPNTIVSLTAWANRLIVGDVRESVTYVVYKDEFNRFVPFADDTVSRWTTTASMVDYDTVAGGDKFGNLWVVRCADKVSRDADSDGRNGHIMNERSYMGGAPNRLELRAHYFTQDIPMSIQRTPLLAGGDDVMFWAGIQGTLGMLIPFVSRQDLRLFEDVQLHMRTVDPPLTGRDHLAYRSYYAPMKSVVDGDLCEKFLTLSYDQKQKVAAECEKPVALITQKIMDMRSRVAY